MDMKDFLAGVRIAVGHQAIATSGHSQFPGDLRAHGHQVAEQSLVIGPGGIEGGDVLFGDQEHVDGGGRVDVPEGEAQGVFVDDVRRDLPVPDLAEKAVGHGAHSRPWSPSLSRALGAVLCLAAVLGAACAGAPKSSAARLDEALKRFHHDLRWQYHDTAASRVDPQHAARFQDQLDDQKDDLRITSWEIRRVEVGPQGGEANVRVRLNYYKMPSTVVHEDMVRQWWKQLEGAWRLMRVEGGPLRFPPPGSEPSDGDPRPEQETPGP